MVIKREERCAGTGHWGELSKHTVLHKVSKLKKQKQKCGEFLGSFTPQENSKGFAFRAKKKIPNADNSSDKLGNIHRFAVFCFVLFSCPQMLPPAAMLVQLFPISLHPVRSAEAGCEPSSTCIMASCFASSWTDRQPKECSAFG